MIAEVFSLAEERRNIATTDKYIPDIHTFRGMEYNCIMLLGVIKSRRMTCAGHVACMSSQKDHLGCLERRPVLRRI
jgi:hypothetical protein